MDKQKLKKFLAQLGIEIWRNKTAIDTTTKDFPKASENMMSQVQVLKSQTNSKSWESLRRNVSLCQLCSLCKSRKQTVFGSGNRRAELLLIGEAPGANEDQQGEPFVGRAGMLLNSMLFAIGLKRDDVYIANILKCRPPQNRDPSPEEVQLCTPFLSQQIALLQPKLIVAVGRIAAQFLLNTTESMARLRGRQYRYGPQNIPLLVTYHPAYLLRSPREKSKAYADLLLIKKMLSIQRSPSAHRSHHSTIQPFCEDTGIFD